MIVGKYPRLRYFLGIVRRMVVAEHYSQLFRRIVSERKNIGRRLYNSIIGLTKRTISQLITFLRIVITGNGRKIRYLSDKLAADGQERPARLLRLAADAYGLAQVLEDNSFLTCSLELGQLQFQRRAEQPWSLDTGWKAVGFNHHFLGSFTSSWATMWTA